MATTVTPPTAGPPIESATPSKQSLPESPIAPPVKPEAAPSPKPETLSTRQEINTALETVGKQYLEQKDPRIGVIALARLAGEQDSVTPMGTELRQDVIRSLQMGETTPDAIRNLKIPEKPETGAFEAFLQQHPDAFDPKEMPRLLLKIRAGHLTVGELSNTIQDTPALREQYMDGLLGKNHAQLNTSDDLLHALKIDSTDANKKQLMDTFKPDNKVPVSLAERWQQFVSVSFSTIMIMQFFQSLAGDSAQGGH